MPYRTLVRPGLYQDSITLMRVADQLSAVDDVQTASAVMGTDANKQLLDDAGMLTADAAAAAANDLVLVVEAATDEAAVRALEQAESLLDRGPDLAGGDHQQAPPPRALAAALEQTPDANLLLVSTPGPYAGAEALKGLKAGLHVFLFSDNVPVSQEVALKEEARRRGRLLMGPDCGTAIIGGVGLGFANAVAAGSIGVVGPSGTGLQLVTVLVDRFGGGVSHAIGAGSHDLSDAVGGVTTLQGLDALAEDAATTVIALVSKPPSPAVAARVLDRCARLGKPAVVTFLGLRPEDLPEYDGVTVTRTLDEAARRAVAVARDGQEPAAPETSAEFAEVVNRARQFQGAPPRYLRGLFSGGTLCTETLVILHDLGLRVHSNIPIADDLRLADLRRSQQHTCIDLGADEFTVGRPHPMIDFRARVERLRREAEDDTVGVILLDVVLGFGAHTDPAGELAPAIRDVLGARDDLTVIAAVCGTERDPQRLGDQEAALRAAGALVAASNADAARAAAWVLGAPASV